MEEEEMRLMSQLLQKLSQRELAAIFNHPVMASEYPDYHQIVSTPMDLGTIQENIRHNVYPSLEACAKDVRTVWTNAYLYNPAKSVVAQGARALSKVFEGMYNKINPTDFNYAREPNVDERNKLSRDIYRVEDSQLAEAIGLLEQRCPDAVVRDNEEGYFVVKIEALPSPVFWEVELYLRKRLCNQPDRTKKKIPTTYRPPPESMSRLSGRKRSNSGGCGDDGNTGGGSRGESSNGVPSGDSSESRGIGTEVGGVSDGGLDQKRKTDDAGAAGATSAAVATMANGDSSHVVIAGGGGTTDGEVSDPASKPAAVAPGPEVPAPAGGDELEAGIETGELPEGTDAAEALSETTTTADNAAAVMAWEEDLFLADTSFRETSEVVGFDAVSASGARQ